MATAPDTNVLPFTGSPIARKLALVMAEVHRVPKNGRNDFHKYNYIMESDLVDALRSKLADQGVAVLPSIVEHTAETIKDNRNRESILATVTMDVTFIDGESGDTRTVTWIGQGVDSGDKAYYKAYTGAFKYALMKTFMVSSGDDPEVDDQPAPRRQGPRREQRPQQRQERRQEQPAPRSKKDVDPAEQFEERSQPAHLSDPGVAHEVNRYKELIKEAMIDGATQGQAKAYAQHVSDLFGVGSLRDLDAAQLKHINGKLAALYPDDRAGYMLKVSEGVTDNVILPLPGHTPPDRQKEIKRFCAIASEPFAKESSGSKDTAESFRQALKVKWGVESFNDVEVNTIVKAADALKALDLKSRHIHMTQMIKEVEG